MKYRTSMLCRYKAIVADPPWRVSGSQGDGRPWASKGGRRSRETFFPYETQTLEWIEALPVGELASPHSHLYLWVPARFNREGHGVDVRAWGFEVVSEIVWDKLNFGLGKFPRPQHEIVLVCRRGKLPFQVNNVGSVQRWHQPRAKGNGGRIHSAKPDGFLDLVEQASPGPYLELFARRQRLGWDTWGDEALEHVEFGATGWDAMEKLPCLYPLPDGRRCLECEACQPEARLSAANRKEPA